MTAVTTDGASIGVEHSDHPGCSSPVFLVTATPPRSPPKHSGSGIGLCCVEAADSRSVATVTASTTRTPAE
jgi:hypothetical protein